MDCIDPLKVASQRSTNLEGCNQSVGAFVDQIHRQRVYRPAVVESKRLKKPIHQ